ncbi:MAG: polyprenol monophosphomannose synthase [Patescibacteria group bacterium]|nr:polyprenol monophosphomannose synthase [Patescibacteria group bacterium]
MSRALVVIPTYNERENIGRLIKEIFSQNLPLDILVVDDNSPDGTGNLVEEMKKTEPRLFILHRNKKEGIGRAYLEGFKWALSKNYEYILEMDADFSHDPRELGSLLESARENDLVLGSRYIKGGKIIGWSWPRRTVSYFGSLYARIILGLGIHDLTGGFKCFKRIVLETIDLDKVKSNGFVFQIEMTYLAKKNGFKIKEVPITFRDRTAGHSKFDKKIFFEALRNVWLLRFGRAK